MKRPNKGSKRVVPQPGGEVFHEGAPAPLDYSMQLPPVKSRGRLVPVQDSPSADLSEPLNGPPPVAEADFLTGEVGPPISQMPMPPVKSRRQLIPRPDWQTGESAPQSPKDDRVNRPLVPASEDVAQLPRGAREAFAARCAARVERLRAGVTRPEGAAALILAAATVETPIRRQLLCIRRDFDRLVYLAKQHNWTDDMPVPPDVFGPMWPEGLTPEWAKEPSTPPSAPTTE